MLNRLWRALLGTASSETPQQSTPQTPSVTWRESPELTTVDEIAPGITVSMTVQTGHHGFLAVVGESHYQDNLRKAWSATSEERVTTATLVPEPNNPHDPNAVAVYLEPFGKVGYIPRYAAPRFSRALQAHHANTTCPAQLRSASGFQIGVVLDPTRAVGAKLAELPPPSSTDYDSIHEWHAKRKANDDFVARTRKEVEPRSLKEAIECYRAALNAVREYEALAAERALFPHIPRGSATREVAVLDRLTRALLKAGRVEEAISEADRYFEDFPDALKIKAGQTVKARVDKQRPASGSTSTL